MNGDRLRRRQGQIVVMAAAVVAVVSLTSLASCKDGESPFGYVLNALNDPPHAPVVSDPQLPAYAASPAASASAGRANDADFVFVSLPPGTIPTGGFATIRDARTGGEAAAAMSEGGFDPVALRAAVGDTIAVNVRLEGGGTKVLYLVVPARRRPVVVRADPPPRKRDVPLNSAIVMIFSEPVQAKSVSGIRVLQNGSAVSGTTILTADGLRAEFRSLQPLSPNTDYVLSVPGDVVDLTGDQMGTPVTTAFTTGTAIIAASVATDPVALVTNPFNQTLRTFAMSASRLDDGTVSGTFSIFYPASGVRVFGRVTCFTIKDGNAAWVAGAVQSAGDPTAIGQEFGWRALDNGQPEGGIPDELSLAVPLADYGLGTAQDFCANTPVLISPTDTLDVYPLVSGNIVVNGAGPPPPPTPDTTSEVAYAAWPYGGIEVVKANGIGGRVLTSDSGDFHPRWSPDGTKLAFDRYNRTKGGRDIYVINADGSGLKRLTSDGFDDYDPAWSPDGGKLAFGRGGAIYTMNPTDGSGLIALTTGGFDWYPTWSPDGTKIAFGSTRSGRNAVYVMSANGSNLQRLLSSESEEHYRPAWSPDGNWIAFEIQAGASNVVYLVHPDGTGLTWFAVGQTAAWSPAGRVVVYEQYGLHLLSVDGSGTGRLGTGFEPSWSPHGALPPLGPPTPAEPAVLVATAKIDSISLVWTDQSNNETGFRIERRSTAPGDSVFAVIATIDAQSVIAPHDVSYIDGGLSSGTTYTYRVRAFNNAGQSSPTNEASATPLPASAPIRGLRRITPP